MGKRQKKNKAAAKAQEIAILDSSKDIKKKDDKTEVPDIIVESKLVTTISMIKMLGTRLELFRSPKYKELRR